MNTIEVRVQRIVPNVKQEKIKVMFDLKLTEDDIVNNYVHYDSLDCLIPKEQLGRRKKHMNPITEELLERLRIRDSYKNDFKYTIHYVDYESETKKYLDCMTITDYDLKKKFCFYDGVVGLVRKSKNLDEAKVKPISEQWLKDYHSEFHSGFGYTK